MSANRRDENINTIVRRDSATEIGVIHARSGVLGTFSPRKIKLFYLFNFIHIYIVRSSPAATCVRSHPNRDRSVSRNPKCFAMRGICFNIDREKEERQNEQSSEQNDRAISTRVTRAKKSDLSILVRVIVDSIQRRSNDRAGR